MLGIRNNQHLLNDYTIAKMLGNERGTMTRDMPPPDLTIEAIRKS